MVEGAPPRQEWSPRPSAGLGSWIAIALGAALTATGFILTTASAPCRQFHLAVELAGSDARLASWIPGCRPDLAAARASLAWDLVLIAGYVLLSSAILRRWWPLYQAPRLKAAEHVVVGLPLAAGVLDLLENGLIVLGLDARDGRFAYPDRLPLPITIATVSWLKWLALAAVLVTTVMACMLGAARRAERRLPTLSEREAGERDAFGPPPAGLGVCCSGGGIRAGAFAIGALERLEQRTILARADWLTAVSGGAYAATAWTLLRAADPDRPPGGTAVATDVIDWLQGPIPGSSTRRHRFLRNGPGGLGRSVIAAIAYVAFNLVVLGALVYALAWPLGWVIGSDAVQPALRRLGELPERLDIPAELWLPGVLVIVAGVVVLGASSLPWYRVAGLWRVAAVLVAVGVVLEIVLVGIPLALIEVGQWMQGGTASGRAAVVGTTALAGVGGTVWRLASKPIIGRLSSRLPELGGLLLLAAAAVWGGKVVTDAARGEGLFRSPIVWAAVTLGFVLVYLFVGISGPTIHRIYRKRLRRTFGLSRDPSGAVFAPDDRGQVTWDALPATKPELVICCAQQRTGIAPGGLPAETFTISRAEVRIGEHVVPTAAYVAALPPSLAVERSVASWIATSGAAFASAMGRISKGSTNALLAALNIDLGIWLPNPRLVEDPHTVFPKVRFGYLFKEILGWYDSADRYVFVADGGHWENLGLVELLRRRAKTIVCIDASGDTVGAFTTLRQAVELAGLELPEIVADVDLEDLESISAAGGALPTGIVASLRVTYHGPPGADNEGTILYAKAQLASDLDIALRRYAKADPRFPNYSTGDQFLTDEQFSRLVELGRAAGDRIAAQLLDGGDANGRE